MKKIPKYVFTQDDHALEAHENYTSLSVVLLAVAVGMSALAAVLSLINLVQKNR